MVLFSMLYGIISYTFSYYGEMITYLGMTMPMAVFALVSWLKNPYNGNKAEVKVNTLGKKETVCMWIGTFVVTCIFYFILEYFNTANDIVLIVLWVWASMYEVRYISVAVCFMAFLVNDVYGFISWRRMKIRQHGIATAMV